MITCVFENGGKGNLRHVTVGIVALNDTNQVLLVKRAKNLVRGGLYTIPGGFLDRDENTKDAARRELEEESGYTVEITTLFYINSNPKRPKENRQNVDFIYLGKIIGGKKKLSTEVTAIDWFDKNNLPDDSQFAFDHRKTILKVFVYLKKPCSLPIVC
jgi:ADP-ribose pyrophosphatase YjhB (NUDIX family)